MIINILSNQKLMYQSCKSIINMFIKKKDLYVDEGFICRHRTNIKVKVIIFLMNVSKHPNMIFLFSNLKKNHRVARFPKYWKSTSTLIFGLYDRYQLIKMCIYYYIFIRNNIYFFQEKMSILI